MTLSGIRITLAPAFTRTVRHAESGPVMHRDQDILVRLAGPADRLRAIAAIEVDDYRADLLWGPRLIAHPGHADPLFLHERGGSPTVSLILYDPGAAHRSGSRVTLIAEDAREVIQARSVDSGVAWPHPEPLASDLDADDRLRISADGPVEVIRQAMVAGRFVERHQRLPAGAHTLDLDVPDRADAFGVAVNVDLGGDAALEHKHMVFGHFGQASGRHVLVDGTVLAPKTPDPFRYRSLLVLDGSDPPPGFARIEAASDAQPAFALAGDAPGFDAAILSEMARLASASGDDPGRTWVEATRAALGGEHPQYGYRFCQPDMSVPVERANAADRRRRLLRSSPCHDCPTATACDSILPFPYPMTDGLPTFAAGAGGCRLREALEKIDRH